MVSVFVWVGRIPSGQPARALALQIPGDQEIENETFNPQIEHLKG